MMERNLIKLKRQALATCLMLALCSLPHVAAADTTSAELVAALGIPADTVLWSSLYIVSGGGPLDTGESAEANPERGSILLSSGLGADQGLGDTDFEEDTISDATRFQFKITIPQGARLLRFKSRFITNEYDGGLARKNDSAFCGYLFDPQQTAEHMPLGDASSATDKTGPEVQRTIDVTNQTEIQFLFQIQDSGDGAIDSALIISNFEFIFTATCDDLGPISELIDECILLTNGDPNLGALSVSPGPYYGSILISTGLAEDKGHGSADLGEDGVNDITEFRFFFKDFLPTTTWLVFTTQFITSEFDPNLTKSNDWAQVSIFGAATAPIRLGDAHSSQGQTNPKVTYAVRLLLQQGATKPQGVQFVVLDKDNPLGDSALLISRMYLTDTDPRVPGWESEYDEPPPISNLSTGSYTYNKELIRVPGIGLPFNFSIHYSSASMDNGVMGRKWRHGYQWEVQELENGDGLVKHGYGGQERFEPSGGGAYTPKFDGVHNTLVKNPDGTFLYTTKNHMKYAFDSAGKCTKTQDPNGNAITLSYNTDKMLTSVGDTRGKTASFTYDADSRLASVTYDGQLEVSFTYNDQGDLVSFAEPGSLVTTFTYDGDGNLLTGTNNDAIQFIENQYYQERLQWQKDANGAVKSYSYDADTMEITDALGHTQILTFDILDRLYKKVGVAGGISTSNYDADNNITSQIDALENETTMTYDSNGNLLSVTDPLGNLSAMTYDTRSNPLTVTDPSGLTSTYTYDGADNLLRQTDPLGNFHVMMYTASGQLQSITDPMGYVTTYGYGPEGDAVSATNALGQVVSFTYHSLGRLRTLTDPNGNTTSYAYDPAGRVSSTTDALGGIVIYSYDAEGRLLSTEEQNGAVTEFSYSPTGMLETITDPLGNTTSFAYDAGDNLISSTDPLGRTTEFSYDEADRLSDVTSELGYHVSSQYDIRGSRLNFTDPNGNSTTFEYDALGRLISEKDPLGSTVTNMYDSRGLIISVKNARNQTVGYEYDGAGRLYRILPPGYSIVHQLDVNGNPVRTVGKDAKTIERNFDPLNRLISRTDDFGNTVHWEYGSVGNIVRITYSDGKAVNYEYVSLNRLIRVTDWAGNVTSYAYDAVGNLKTTTLPDGFTVIYAYDLADRLTGISDRNQENNAIYSAEFTLNAAGMRTAADVHLPLEPSIDTLDREMVYNSGNQLTANEGNGFSYDADGNMIEGAVNGSSAQLEYDEFNQLVRIGSDTYRYDSDGSRIEATIGSKTVRYVQDPNAVFSRVLEEQDENGTIIARYVYGLGLISREEASSGSIRVYHFDSRGSTIALTDQAGQIKDRYAYDPFGKVVNRQGSTPNPFTYSGRLGVMDDDNGLYYMRQRYYGPNLMRFIHKDPTFRGTLGMSQSLNRYTYAEGNPIQWVDPEGDIPIWVAGALVGVGIQAGLDIYHGEFSGWGAYAGMALEGAIAAEFGWSGAVVGAMAGNIVKQKIEGTSDPYQLQQAVLLGAIGGGIGKVGGKAFEKVGNRAAKRAGQGFIGRAMDRGAKKKYMKIVLKRGGSEKLGKLYKRARNATGGPVIPVDVTWVGQLTQQTLDGLVTGVGVKLTVGESEIRAIESFLNDL